MEYEPNPGYQEILKLDKMLTEAKIPHKLKKPYDSLWQIIYSCKGDRIYIIRGTYWVFVSEKERQSTIKNNLTPEQIFENIKNQTIIKLIKE